MEEYPRQNGYRTPANEIYQNPWLSTPFGKITDDDTVLLIMSVQRCSLCLPSTAHYVCSALLMMSVQRCLLYMSTAFCIIATFKVEYLKNLLYMCMHAKESGGRCVCMRACLHVPIKNYK